MRRGQKELDVILEAFMRQNPTLSSFDQQLLAELLNLSDPELASLFAQERAPDPKFADLLQRILHASDP